MKSKGYIQEFKDKMISHLKTGGLDEFTSDRKTVEIETNKE